VILLAPARAAARVLTGGDGDALVGRGVGSEVSLRSMAAVVSILRRTRRLVTSGMSAVASRKGTSAIFGPIPIRSSRKVSMTKAASSDSRSFIPAPSSGPGDPR
jgi:hypothetical protein